MNAVDALKKVGIAVLIGVGGLCCGLTRAQTTASLSNDQVLKLIVRSNQAEQKLARLNLQINGQWKTLIAQWHHREEQGNGQSQVRIDESLYKTLNRSTRLLIHYYQTADQGLQACIHLLRRPLVEKPKQYADISPGARMAMLTWGEIGKANLSLEAASLDHYVTHLSALREALLNRYGDPTLNDASSQNRIAEAANAFLSDRLYAVTTLKLLRQMAHVMINQPNGLEAGR